MAGTRIQGTVVRVVDGDTVRVEVNGDEESLRLLALDTEESNAGSSKPVTPWGHAAKDRANQVIAPGDTVTLEFPGHEAPEVCWQKYRGNYGRPLVYLYLPNGTDFQEMMIREGYSPYFVKYGYAHFPELHERYTNAERAAQAENLGVWNQMAVNAFEARNYALLGTWWHLRGLVVEGYRQFKRANPGIALYNTRLDYDLLVDLAEQRQEVTIFTELRDFKRVGGKHGIISVGSIHQPFQIFVREIDSDPAQTLLRFLMSRYIPGDGTHPRRSYAYIRGMVKMFGSRPELELERPSQVTDWPVAS